MTGKILATVKKTGPAFEKTVRWFARGGGIRKCGPYETQIRAVEAMRLVSGGFPSDVFVWPEVKK